jgi:hypothetical protein
MSEFHDPELRQQLGRLSGPYPDDNAAFAAWQRRVVQARRRRAVGWITGAAMSLIVATVAVAALQSPTRHSLVPSDSTESSAEPTVSVAEADEPSTVETTMPETSAPTTDAPETTPSSEVAVEMSPPADDGAIAGGAPPSGTSNKGHGTPSTPAPAVVANTQTFTSVGGTVTVQLDGDRLTVVAANASAGFRTEDNTDSRRKVQITFKSGDHQSHVTVRLSDGVMQGNVSEEADEHRETTVPDETSPDGGDHGGDSDKGKD